MDAVAGGFHASSQSQAPVHNSALPLVLKAARACGLEARRDEIQRALDDAQHGAAFAEWATTHLGPDTLLTPDELAFYSALDTSGQVDKLAPLYNLSEVQPIPQDDLRRAIQELRQSTDTVIKQTDTMQQKQKILSLHVEKQRADTAQRQQVELEMALDTEAERKQVAIEVDRLSHSITLKLCTIEEQLQEDDPKLRALISDALHSDDKLLAGLQKLDGELDAQGPEDSAWLAEYRENCHRVIEDIAQTVRTTLDATYLDALVAAESGGDGKPVSDAQVEAVLNEVESLYPDITSVTQMKINEEYLEPAVKSIALKNKESINRTSMALDYMDECLLHLHDRISSLCECVERHESRHALTTAIAASAKAELAAQVSEANDAATHTVPASPARRASLSTLDKMSTPHARRSSAAEAPPPLEQLLRKLSLEPASTTSSLETRLREVEGALNKARAKLVHVERGAHESYQEAIVKHVHDIWGAVQMMRDSVLAESPYGKVELVDADVEYSINAMKEGVAHVRQRLQALEEQELVEESEVREELLQRFGLAP
ncbi:hypothetical protein CDD81_4125 [Ophiocordyceps australis]|uniref:HAUS augmin-like complex subunit 3 N-terminal domain-containing protein n=1 Tax=Ophiocordyceps australis TaxID=1399860 RepID=A0A2C5YCJ7_9HYPO|nr:hypothetical protein CDD81_4125 [Ophiocordyceps australis]